MSAFLLSMREASSRARVVLPDRSTLFMREGIADGHCAGKGEDQKQKPNENENEIERTEVEDSLLALDVGGFARFHARVRPYTCTWIHACWTSASSKPHCCLAMEWEYALHMSLL